MINKQVLLIGLFLVLFTSSASGLQYNMARYILKGSDSPSKLSAYVNRTIPIDSGLRATDYWFFLEEKTADGSSKLPRKDDQSKLQIGDKFGCYIKYETKRRSLEFRAELSGPASLAHFHPKGQRVKFSDDEKRVFVENTINEDDESYGYFFTLDPGDPKGRYELKCYLEDKLIVIHPFELTK